MSENAVPTIDVVVPVHGNWAMTESCLRHLRQQSLPHTVIVVDDASPDDTLQRLAQDWPEVVVVPLPENRGFASACNAGVRRGSGEIVVLLNNDVDAAPDMLAELVRPFADAPRLGSAAPLLLRPDGRVDALGIAADVTLAGFVRHQGRRPEEVSAPAPALLGPYGAAAAYRRAALDEVGLLDEAIFMYGEELDLALRLRAAGWGSTETVAARGVHMGGGTAGRGSRSQRRRGGFGRGYLLRAYGVLRGRHAVRALVTEAIVCAGDLVLSRDTAALQGRWAGWRAGRRAEPRPAPAALAGLDPQLDFAQSLRLRRGDYAAASSSATPA
ncbi:glycosyltransferase family 2 protein [Modestobacter sp. SYSU DS0290]